MLLVIPSITIRNGVCVGKINYPGVNNNSLTFEKPEDRARLLRKENAKALHLNFEGSAEWNSENLALIESIRKVVDIPIEVSLSSIPDDISCVKQLLDSGIYRLFLPEAASDYFLTHCISDFSRQKIAVSIPLESASQGLLARLKNDGIIRLAITLPDDENALPTEELRQVAAKAQDAGLRLSLFFGVHSYKELIHLSGLAPGFDSVILGRALENNVFPCQGIWRESEMRASLQVGTEANLWKNPLQTVHS